MRVELGRLLGVYTDPVNPIAAVVVYMAKPGIEAASATEEATEIRYFAPSDIPWREIAFATTHGALRDWLTAIEPERRS
jgi:hypothetical protein